MVVNVDVASSGINGVREAWESQRKNYTAEFFEADPCDVSCFFTLIFFRIMNSCCLKLIIFNFFFVCSLVICISFAKCLWYLRIRKSGNKIWMCV